MFLHPVAYISRALTDTEVNYGQIKKEVLAITCICQWFHQYLTGLHFNFVIDHRSLVPLSFTKSLNQLPARVQRFWLQMIHFDYSINVPGVQLQIADALSRSPVLSTFDDMIFRMKWQHNIEMLIQSLPVTDKRLQEMLTAQDPDPTWSQLKILLSK